MLLTFQEIHEGRAGGDEISSKEQSKATRVRKFRATVSSPYDGPDVVIAAMNPLGTPHPVLANCFLVRRQVENHAKSKLVFMATASYSTDPIVAPGSPLNDPAEISWATEQISRVYQFDQAGNAVLNSANQQFVPGTQDTDAYWVCTVKKNVTRVPAWLLNFRNTVNAASFTVDGIQVPQLCGWMKAISIGHIQYRMVGALQVPYRALQFTIACKSGQVFGKGKQGAIPGGAGPAWPIRDDWKRYILDEGTLVATVAGNPNLPNYSQPLPAANADGSTARSKVLLNGLGEKLTGGPLGNGTPDTAVFMIYILKPAQNFNSLPLK